MTLQTGGIHISLPSRICGPEGGTEELLARDRYVQSVTKKKNQDVVEIDKKQIC